MGTRPVHVAVACSDRSDHDVRFGLFRVVQREYPAATASRCAVTPEEVPMTVLIEELTREAAKRAYEAGATVILPTGSIEQHGAHLPVFTDTLVVSHIAREAALADRKSTRLNSSHSQQSRMPSSA